MVLKEKRTDLVQQNNKSTDDAEARNDFGSISGNDLYPHHVQQRVKLYMLREGSFPIPRCEADKYDIGCVAGMWYFTTVGTSMVTGSCGGHGPFSPSLQH